jgi:hypothetical protein
MFEVRPPVDWRALMRDVDAEAGPAMNRQARRKAARHRKRALKKKQKGRADNGIE